VSRHAERWPLALLLVAATALLTLANSATGDYAVELRPSVDLLLAGHVSAFLTAAPVYGPSVFPRIPFMFAADAAGAGWVGVYLAGALACMFTVTALAYVLDGRLGALQRPRAIRVAVVLTCLLAPVLTRAAPMGHPEDVLAGGLCALALLAALSGHSGWAGVALGGAIASKPWAVIAVLPALLAADGGRIRLLLFAAATTGAAELPFFLFGSPSRAGGTVSTLTSTPHYFHPTQLFWPLRDAIVDPVSGVTGYRGPVVIERLSHPVIVLLGIPLSALFALRLHRGRVQRHDALALLALLLFARSLLDPWNSIYYVLPAILALVSWEALARNALPIGAMALSGLTYLSFVALSGRVGADVQAASYLAWAVPAIVLLARVAFFGAPRGAERGAAQPMISATAARTSPGAI
jgi:hypothetical protein